MCISNTPLWLDWIIVLSLPLVLILINFIMIKYTSVKRYKLWLIIPSLLVGLYWLLYWVMGQFFTLCI